MVRGGLGEGGVGMPQYQSSRLVWGALCFWASLPRTEEEGEEVGGGSPEAPWNCWGSAPPWGLKAFQGSIELQGGQMGGEEERGGDRLREQESMRTRKMRTEALGETEKLGDMERWGIQKESGARKCQEISRNKGHLWREREKGP